MAIVLYLHRMVKLVKLFVATALLFPMVLHGQEGFFLISFNSEEHDFGVVSETDGRLYHSFEFINCSDAVVELLEPVPSCSCVTAKLSPKSLKPGQRGSVDVIFDPSGASSLVYRTVDIYSKDGTHLSTLSITADVKSSDNSLARKFPIVLGNELRADVGTVHFGYSYWGETLKKIVEVANLGKERVRLSAESSSSSLSVVCPEYIEPESSVSITLISSIPDTPDVYQMRNDHVYLYVDGRKVGHDISVERILLGRLKNASFSPSMLTYPSVAHLKKSFLSKSYSGAIEISNTGKGDLVILAVNHDNDVECSLKAGTELRTGEKCRVSASSMRDSFKVEIFTNDPLRPYKELIFNNYNH